MTRVASYDTEYTLGATECMNDLAQYLLDHGLIECDDECGVQEASRIIHDFEVHVIKKRKR